ncbi:MAG: hypothetical protein MJB14_17205, partial [Spirochaetes bacterium]|nr:hypothetical protein [Spirochaetota bacterium]
YCKLLADSIKDLQKQMQLKENEVLEEEIEVFLDLEYTGFIPDSYIADPKQKIEVYKKISGVIHEEEIASIKHMLEDRFGKIPEEVIKLLYMANIRILCRKLAILEMVESSSENKYGERSSVIEIKFSNAQKLNIPKIMQLVAQPEGKLYIDGSKPESIFIRLSEEMEIEKKGEFLKEILQELIVE